MQMSAPWPPSFSFPHSCAYYSFHPSSSQAKPSSLLTQLHQPPPQKKRRFQFSFFASLSVFHPNLPPDSSLPRQQPRIESPPQVSREWDLVLSLWGRVGGRFRGHVSKHRVECSAPVVLLIKTPDVDCTPASHCRSWPHCRGRTKDAHGVPEFRRFDRQLPPSRTFLLRVMFFFLFPPRYLTCITRRCSGCAMQGLLFSNLRWVHREIGICVQIAFLRPLMWGTIACCKNAGFLLISLHRFRRKTKHR